MWEDGRTPVVIHTSELLPAHALAQGLLPSRPVATRTQRADPPVRSDRRCAQRGCTRQLATITSRHRRYGGDALLVEPFCSTECCRAYHGVGLAPTTTGPRPRRRRQ